MLTMTIGLSAASPETTPPIDIYAETTGSTTNETVPIGSEAKTRESEASSSLEDITKKKLSESIAKGDSFNLTSEEINKLKIENPDNQVIKKYLTAFCFLFPGSTSVSDMVKSEEIIAEQYIILENNSIVSYQTLQSGESTEINGINENKRASDEAFVSKINTGKNMLAEVSNNIEVNSIHYFVDTTYLGSCIYYETNEGDYVYYKGFVSNETRDYLFPASDFIDLITLVYNERLKNPYSSDGSVNIEDYMDVSQYDMNSPTFDPALWRDKSGALLIEEYGNITENPTFWYNKVAFWGTISALCVAFITVIILAIKRIYKNKQPKI